MGKVSIVRIFGLPTNLYCFLKVLEDSEVCPVSIDADSYSPRLNVFSPVDSRMSASVIRTNAVVLSVLSRRAHAKVFVPIIERISVNMIAATSLWSPKDHGMHRHRLVLFPIGSKYISSCIKRLGAWVPRGVPVELQKFFVSVCRYFGYLSLREWDNAVGLVKRLNNRLAAHATFGHDSTSNGIAVFDRFSIVSGGI
jgi:hypothetical protein